jgi:hypothetical protein
LIHAGLVFALGLACTSIIAATRSSPWEWILGLLGWTAAAVFMGHINGVMTRRTQRLLFLYPGRAVIRSRVAGARTTLWSDPAEIQVLPSMRRECVAFVARDSDGQPFVFDEIENGVELERMLGRRKIVFEKGTLRATFPIAVEMEPMILFLLFALAAAAAKTFEGLLPERAGMGISLAAIAALGAVFSIWRKRERAAGGRTRLAVFGFWFIVGAQVVVTSIAVAALTVGVGERPLETNPSKSAERLPAALAE